MPLRKELLQTRLPFSRPIQRLHEQSPLLLVQHKTGLIRKGFLSSLPGCADDEIGNVETLPFRRHFDQGLFARSRPKLKASILGLFGY